MQRRENEPSRISGWTSELMDIIIPQKVGSPPGPCQKLFHERCVGYEKIQPASTKRIAALSGTSRPCCSLPILQPINEWTSCNLFPRRANRPARGHIPANRSHMREHIIESHVVDPRGAARCGAFKRSIGSVSTMAFATTIELFATCTLRCQRFLVRFKDKQKGQALQGEKRAHRPNHPHMTSSSVHHHNTVHAPFKKSSQLAITRVRTRAPKCLCLFISQFTVDLRDQG